MIRFFDFILSLFGILLLWPIGIVICIIGLFDTGSPILAQKRVGRYKQSFTLYKFRTMHLDTKPTASHLAEKSKVTKWGCFLRKTKLDEFPQLINVLKGEMSLVGARPTIFGQKEVIREREKRGVYRYRPGITGLAQINAIDTSTPVKQALVDAKMMRELTLIKYFKYIIFTILGKGAGDRIPEKNREKVKPTPPEK